MDKCYRKSIIEDLKKASQKKEKITLHKGKPLSKRTIETDLHLLFFKINVNTFDFDYFYN